jgi:hypothetical protein
MSKLPAAVSLSLVALGCPAAAQGEEPVLFMKPAPDEARADLPLYHRVDEPAEIERYTSWLDNESARMALALYEEAWATLRERGSDLATPPYPVALIPRGNHADIGFRLQTEAGVEEHPGRSYIKLGPQKRGFENTFLHETGHVVLATLAGGKRVPAEPMASIPHTTAALTNRGTAFNEGFAIHLETLAGHLSDERSMRARYRHERFDFGGAGVRSEYLRHAVDLATFSQTVARYYEVRENNYAFASAFKEPEYLRVQLEKSRDFATLRDANQLLQSEGFNASFFFAYTVRGDGIPDPATVADRQRKMLNALAEMFASKPMAPDSPYLLHFLETYMRLYPSDAGEVVDILLDLSHGVFVDAEAPALWRKAYMTALTLDIRNFPPAETQHARTRWREAVMEDPTVLYARLGPQIACIVPDESVRLVAFGQEMPLSFDLNTVQEGVIRMIPEMTDEGVDLWLAERARLPFASAEDFRHRIGEQRFLDFMRF